MLHMIEKCMGSLLSPANQYKEDAQDEACSFSSLSKKTRMLTNCACCDKFSYFNPLTCEIRFLILPSSCYRFSFKLVMRIW